MRITCPHCGERDLREFVYRGHALVLSRPREAAGDVDWDNYLHNRDNPAGLTDELWCHAPCGTWLEARRDTVTHEIVSIRTLNGDDK